MKHLKKFEELEYTSAERNQYQSKIDSIVDGFATPISISKYDREVTETPVLKVGVNINDSESSTLSINLNEIQFRIYRSQYRRVLSIYKPGNGWILTNESIDGIYSIIKKCSNYLSLSESELNNIYKVLRKLSGDENHISMDYNI